MERDVKGEGASEIFALLYTGYESPLNILSGPKIRCKSLRLTLQAKHIEGSRPGLWDMSLLWSIQTPVATPSALTDWPSDKAQNTAQKCALKCDDGHLEMKAHHFFRTSSPGLPRWSIPGMIQELRSHIPRSQRAQMLQLLSPYATNTQSMHRKERSHMLQLRPNAAK